MSVIPRLARQTAALAAMGVLLCGLSGCAEVKSQIKDSGEFLHGLFMNAISRFPEGGDQSSVSSDSAVLPPKFQIAPLADSALTATVSEDVNIRSGPNAQYDHLGSFLAGTEVKIYHQVLLGNSPWGLTEAGWISMNYVVLEDPAKAVAEPLAEKKTGVLVLPELQLRAGPGWQYPVTATVEGYSREELLAKSGNWYQTARGWVYDEQIYVEGIAPIRVGTVTGSEVNIRQGPGTQYATLGTVLKNEVLTIFHQVSVDGKPWGYFGEGWISLNYVKLEKTDGSNAPEETEPDQTMLQLGLEDSAILGTWRCLGVNKEQNTVTSVGVWHFNADGTFLYIGEDSYYHYNDATGLTSGMAAKADGQELSGLFAYDGETLALFCTEAKGEGAEESVPYVRLIGAMVKDGVMTMTSGDSMATLYSGALEDVAAKLLKG